MPKLTGNETAAGSTASGFSYSGTKIEHLGAIRYTLVNISVDRSGSVAGFKAELVHALEEAIKGCQMSPLADCIMVRVTTFADSIFEVHGFIPVAQLDPASYAGCLDALGGYTALYEAAQEGVEAIASYGERLLEKDYVSNGVVFVITDGEDNRGGRRFTAKTVGAAMESVKRAERLESILPILIGVNVAEPSVRQALMLFETDGGFAQYVDAKDVSAKGAAKLGRFISQSVSAQSQSLGTGGPSQPLTF